MQKNSGKKVMTGRGMLVKLVTGLEIKHFQQIGQFMKNAKIGRNM